MAKNAGGEITKESRSSYLEEYQVLCIFQNIRRLGRTGKMKYISDKERCHMISPAKETEASKLLRRCLIEILFSTRVASGHHQSSEFKRRMDVHVSVDYRRLGNITRKIRNHTTKVDDNGHTLRLNCLEPTPQ